MSSSASKIPDLAVVMGHDPEGHGGDGEDTDPSEEDAALEDAGRAAMKAYASGDPLAFAKAVAACARAAPDDTGEGGDDGDEPFADMDMAKKGKLGSGSRFAAVERSAAESGARDPGAVAAAAGRKAHGQKAMSRYSKMGR